MTRTALVGLILPFLAACGAGVSGPVGEACMASGRSSANSVLCGCIQRVANDTLSGSEQRRAAQFFGDPQRAQDFRTRDDSASEAAWLRYRGFADRAEAICR
ncbi:arginine transporter [Wenxinia saemankumensis]|uniref:Arginine transporter n=1 Tax=Wenxinia saemankumensis TaxID=1447782 RepID=A0A1M6ETV2_9RHOB|nr:arginine transporter [Wenxinia saemankumensis]SHI88810.1 hypothetical protein SAMN05444417_2168 [Wenxinia saemankumensis]